VSVDPSIFKAYDVRGIYPTTLNEETAYKIGQGYADFVKPKGEIAVGHDVRLHSQKLKDEVVRGLTDAGIDVVDVGLISTDMYYFAVGHYQLAGGIQSTASHNPPEYNGIKFCKAMAVPINEDTGLQKIRIIAEKIQLKKDKNKKIGNIDQIKKYIEIYSSKTDKEFKRRLEFISKINDECQHISARLLILICPFTSQLENNFKNVTLPQEVIILYCKKNAVNAINVLDWFQDIRNTNLIGRYYFDEVHLTAKGHEVVAKELTNISQQILRVS